MPRRCSVCDHPDRPAVDAALVAGEPFRNVAARFRLSTSALVRHKTDHIPAALTKAADAAEHVAADTLLDRLRALNAETTDVLRAAKREADHELRLKAIARAERQLELEARLLGELADSATVVNIVMTPEWTRVQTAMLAALSPYPAARVAVADALVAIGEGRA